MSTIFEPMLDPDNYLRAWYKVRQISGWKDGVQRFGLNLLPNIRALIEQVHGGSYQPDPFTVFTWCERGHLRLVKALSPRDQILHHVLCNNVLIPGLRPYLIYDNGASLKGKGLEFARCRLACHLQRHIRRYGTDGYILLLDFRKFFDNILHDRLIAAICNKLSDIRLATLLATILKQHESDISHITAPDLSDWVFDSLKMPPPGERKDLRVLRRGLGIGAPFSQIAGIFYPTPIDNYCKSVLGVKAYARYMDDLYLIHPDKDFLHRALDGIKGQARALGLFVHPAKTQIVKLSHGFTWLKTRYTLTPSGGIVRRLWPKTVTRHRRKLKSLATAVRAGVMPLQDFKNLHRAWLGDKRGYRAYQTLNHINKIYQEALCSISCTAQPTPVNTVPRTPPRPAPRPSLTV